jgi:hypothetical protein
MQFISVSVRSRSRLSVVAVLAILAVVTTATQAVAQLPGETFNDLQSERVGGQQLQLQGTYSEARNGGHLLSVWRGGNNNGVWMSRDNGSPFTIGGTATYVSPTVVPWGPDSFLVFHTGVSGDIWYTAVYSDGSNSGTWYNVPGNTTNLSVSVAQMGANSYNVYMVYRGVGNDQRVWGTWLGGPNGWSSAENISGGLANAGPSVVMNNVSNQLTVAIQGTDNQLWITSQALGAHGWNSWRPEGVYTSYSPHLAVNSNGNMVVSIVNFSHPEYAVYGPWGNQQTGWSGDASITTYNGVQLTANANFIYALMTIPQKSLFVGLWEQIYNGQ